LANNPLSKVPTLITDEGLVIFDSPVVCEFLDGQHQGDRLIPLTGEERWKVLRTQAMCDGILDAAILRFLEAKRDASMRSADWDTQQKSTVIRSLHALEVELAGWSGGISLAHICTGVVLGYLDFRFDHEEWRLDHPNLSAWYNEFSQRESMQATVPKMPS
ncbi:MAG: glutathione S-transferase family protein, partial [Gammaproteobacteria bacterium]|nr:glutathione S-transferase family protein [Gammaproteobacteria bacterium]